MDKNNQIIIAGILIIILAFGVATLFFVQSNAEVKKTESIKNEISIVSAKKMVLLKKIIESKKEKEAFASDLQGYSEKIQSNEAEIVNIQKEKESILAQLQENKDAFSGLQQALEDLKIEESALKDELSKVKGDHEDVIQALESMRSKKSMLEEKIKSYLEASQGVELRKIVVKIADPVDGKIVDINREYNFAVIDLGSFDNVRSGDVLGIYRNSALIAKAIIENIYEDMSSIIVFDEWRNVEIFCGDTVKFLRK